MKVLIAVVAAAGPIDSAVMLFPEVVVYPFLLQLFVLTLLRSSSLSWCSLSQPFSWHFSWLNFMKTR